MSWANEEFKTLNIGDLRLNRRAIHLFDQIGFSPGRTFPQIFQTWRELKACYNFFDNILVTGEKLLAPHIQNTIERIRQFPVVLLPCDTTELDYTTKDAMKGKERVTNQKEGIWLHPTLAVTPERLTLGIVEANFWHRNPEVADKSAASKTARENAPIEEKESYRWLQSYRKACEIAKLVPSTQLIHLADREGDMMEIFEEAVKQRTQGVHANFIIRSQYNRNIESETGCKLWDILKQQASLGEIEFFIPATKKRKERKVIQSLKSTTITVVRKNKQAEVNAVMAIETTPPDGEEPIVWVLITDLPINTFENVKTVISHYLCRWEIELFFKVLKSGCKIEDRQLRTTNRMQNLITLFMVVSWRVMFTMMLGRSCPDLLCSDLFEEAEWKSVYKVLNRNKPIPEKAPTLGEFMIMIAILGGYIRQKSGGPPGVKVIWKGMGRMKDFALAWEAATEASEISIKTYG